MTATNAPIALADQQVKSRVAFPFLPVQEFEKFVKRMEKEEQTAVLREFRDWVKTLPQ